ncbi:hypothetical protein Cgig2_018296 [Carnegiea gigantea]|uniref:Bet v I/Major latex protein domain-containing protein n=1 Tax=Carnegiea gigantea TaxID=171969 RepID=A0A9Q1QRA6_9CARY|nr:hypothetical protein Cgig2_018296 [Carnegiea gigantea]
MAAPGKLEVEVETQSNPDKFWTALLDSYKIFPEAFPDKFKSIEILEGDGKSPGSVRLVKYAEGLPLITMSKEKIETVDEANKTMTYSVIDGELISFYKTFKAQAAVVPNGEGSLVKWSCEFEKAQEDTPNPDLFKEFAVKTFHELDAYLLKA